VISFSLAYPTEAPRALLRKLDRLLSDLEDLNLNEMTHLPIRVGSDLQGLGVSDPYRRSIPDLIDRVFELQEPVLQALRGHRGTPRPAA
jgi:hypothetical protein